MPPPSDSAAHENAAALRSVRTIVANQLNSLENASARGVFTPSEATTLERVMRTYALLDTHTTREHAKYDYSKMDASQLERLERGDPLDGDS